MSWQATAWVSSVEAGGPSGKLLLYALANYADEHGRTFAGDDRIMSDTELSERSVRDWKRKLEEAGLIRIERRRRPGGDFDVDVIQLEMSGGEPPANSAGGDEGATTGKSRRNHRQLAPRPPANGSVPPAPPYKAEPSIEPPVEPEREGAREEENSDQPESTTPDDRTDQPGTAAFEKRVMRFCNGRGFLAGSWPDWDTSSPGWIASQFAKLSPGERAEAERWRDPYLIDIAARKKSPVAVGVFLKGKTWTGLDIAVLQRAEKAKNAALKPDERARPEGWASMLGPVGMAWLVAALLKGPEAGAPAVGAVFIDAQLQRTWPSVWQFNRVQQTRGGLEIAERWHALKPAMEPVPQGSLVLAAWKRAFAEHEWPWLSSFDSAEVVFLPKVEAREADAIGPPDLDAAIGRALEAFEAAVKAETDKGDEDDGDRREAAE